MCSSDYLRIRVVTITLVCRSLSAYWWELTAYICISIKVTPIKTRFSVSRSIISMFVRGSDVLLLGLSVAIDLVPNEFCQGKELLYEASVIFRAASSGYFNLPATNCPYRDQSSSNGIIAVCNRLINSVPLTHCGRRSSALVQSLRDVFRWRKYWN